MPSFATIVGVFALLPTRFASSNTIGDLSPEEFYQKLVSSDYDVIVDVRRDDEWASGHIAGATLVESLANYSPDTNSSLGKPSDLDGCEYCDIIVYCRTGARAGVAIQILRDSGFKGRLWNGKGVTQWTEAGYELVTTDSIAPPCTTNQTVTDICFDNWENVANQETPVTPAPSTPSSASNRTNQSLWLVMGAILMGIVHN